MQLMVDIINSNIYNNISFKNIVSTYKDLR